MHENSIIKDSISLKIKFPNILAIEMFYNWIFEHSAKFSKRIREFYNWIFMHIHARYETLSNIFCFIIEYPHRL